MAIETGTPGSLPASDASREELRATMLRMLDELATARADRAREVVAEFQELWKRIEPTEEDTIH
jgi:hypothetical protein